MLLTLNNKKKKSIKLSLFYTATLAVLGVITTFWPLWLKNRGLEAKEVGFIIAFLHIAKIFANPFISTIVDKKGTRRIVMFSLLLLSYVGFLALLFSYNFYSLFFFSLVACSLFETVIPIGENLTIITVCKEKLDYGKIRLWGSLSFMGGTVLCGFLLKFIADDIILWLTIIFMIFSIIVTGYLPDAKTHNIENALSSWLKLLKNKVFLLVLLTVSLIQSSHACLYGFSTIYWKENGISPSTISLFWVVSIVAEIFLFANSKKITTKINPSTLLLFACLGGIVRWSICGISVSPLILSISMVLHIFTFACAHIAMMEFIVLALPTSFTARAQGLYESISMGAFLGFSIYICGIAYETLQGYTFFIGSFYCFLSVFLIFIINRNWNGKKIIE